MENDIVTTDLSQYGYRELDEAAKLLKAYAENGSKFLNGGITLNLNKNSGSVFLSDEDYNVGVMEGDKIVQFYSCPNCGYEGTQEDAREDWTYSTAGTPDRDNKDFEKYNGYCSKECEDENK